MRYTADETSTTRNEVDKHLLFGLLVLLYTLLFFYFVRFFRLDVSGVKSSMHEILITSLFSHVNVQRSTSLLVWLVVVSVVLDGEFVDFFLLFTTRTKEPLVICVTKLIKFADMRKVII